MYFQDLSGLIGCFSNIKANLPSFLFNVALPSLDVYSDLSLILPWYWNGHWKYALSMTFPLFLQFLSTSYKWVQLEKKENKRWTWILLLLQFWPQWRALRIMHLHYKKDSNAENKKQELLREVTSTEPFLEAWPSIMVMILIWAPLISQSGFTVLYHIISTPGLCEYNPRFKSTCIVFSGPGGVDWFFITFFISVVTGSLGITKFLQIGPFSVLSEEGALGGILKWKFILAFLAVMWSILTKGVLMGLLMGYYASAPPYRHRQFKKVLGTSDDQATNILMVTISLTAVFLPSLLCSLFSIVSSTGINKKFFQVMIRYPASWVLPLATYFTIGSKISLKCTREDKQKRLLGFSIRCSFCNMIISIFMYGGIIAFLLVNDYYDGSGIFKPFWIDIFIPLFIPVLVLGVTFNIIYLVLDEPWCCLRLDMNICLNCCGKDCFKRKIQVIDLEGDDMNIISILDDEDKEGMILS